MALKALELPRKTHPKMMTRARVRPSALTGTSSPGWTLLKNLEAGRPLSLANAQAIRLLVVMMAMVAKTVQTRGNMSRQIAPARELVALYKIARRGPAGDAITSSMFPATNSKHIKKMKPVKVPIATQVIMTKGPVFLGFGISSIICATAVQSENVSYHLLVHRVRTVSYRRSQLIRSRLGASPITMQRHRASQWC
jgi:hypothetical protein